MHSSCTVPLFLSVCVCVCLPTRTLSKDMGLELGVQASMKGRRVDNTKCRFEYRSLIVNTTPPAQAS